MIIILIITAIMGGRGGGTLRVAAGGAVRLRGRLRPGDVRTVYIILYIITSYYIRYHTVLHYIISYHSILHHICGKDIGKPILYTTTTRRAWCPEAFLSQFWCSRSLNDHFQEVVVFRIVLPRTKIQIGRISDQRGQALSSNLGSEICKTNQASHRILGTSAPFTITITAPFPLPLP